MEYASFEKRVLNAIPNYIIVFILFNLLSAFLMIGLGDTQLFNTIFTEKRQTLYEKMTNIVVVEGR